jgi:hypothetical protein
MCSCDNLQGLRPKRQQWQPLKPLNSYGPLIHITINMAVEISVTVRTMSFRTTLWCDWSAPTHPWFRCNLSPNMHCNIGKNNSWELRNLHTKDWERKNKVNFSLKSEKNFQIMTYRTKKFEQHRRYKLELILVIYKHNPHLSPEIWSCHPAGMLQAQWVDNSKIFNPTNC